MSEPRTLQHDEKATPKAAEAATPTVNPFAAATVMANASITPMKKGQVSGVGQWVFDHKQAFSRDNPLAWYGIRNVLNNMVAIVGLMATIVPVRMGMGGVAKWATGKAAVAEAAKNVSSQSFYKGVQGLFGHPTIQGMAGVGVSFSTFRTMYKMGQRSYDRVFGDPKSAEESSQAIADLPKNIWKDFKQIAAVEYPATMTAAVALVGIRNAVNGGAPEGAEMVKGVATYPRHFRDIMGCAFLAYPVFFEMTERLGRDWQLQRGYKDPKTNEHINKDKMTIGEFLTRQVPAVAAGIIPYIAGNNIWHRKTGHQLSYNAVQVSKGLTKIDGFWSGFWKERPYELFFLYTLGRDLYYDAYDWMTGKSSAPGKHADVAPMPHAGGVIADTLPAKKTSVAATSAHPGVEVADAAPQGKVVAMAEHKKPAQPAESHKAQVAADHQGAHHAI